MEDVLGGEDEIHKYVEGGAHRFVPFKASRSPRSTASYRISTSSHRDGKIGPELCLRRMASLRPEYPGQRKIVELGRVVGCSSKGRDEARAGQVKT